VYLITDLQKHTSTLESIYACEDERRMRSSSVQLKKNGRGLVAVPRFRKKGRDEDYGL
jgi:hypothetical protein